MLTQNVEIINKLGLHARASSKLVALANNYKCELIITKDNKSANLKSIMGVMMLAVSKGNMVKLSANGEDEEEALQSLVKLVNDRFGEPE